jgi:hypothetical protein
VVVSVDRRKPPVERRQSRRDDAEARVAMLLLREHTGADLVTWGTTDREKDEGFTNIRCPLCGWQPSASSRWCCDPTDAPEPVFEGCHTVWNTFLTQGRCPGCSHQWQWTICFRCEQWSLHEDWYERDVGSAS